jgi:hypothetical protein
MPTNISALQTIQVLLLVAMLMSLAACAARMNGRVQCDNLVDAAWKELDLAKAQGLDGTVSYTKAASLIAAAKGQQLIERFPSCINKAKRARVYIAESRAGR